MSALGCRFCRVSLAAQTGCSVCDEWRKQFIVVGQDEDEKPSLSGTAHEVVAVLRSQLKTVKGELDRNPNGQLAEKRALAIGNTMAKVLETARKLTQDGVAAVEKLSFQERKELFVSWYTDLAPPYRNAVREAFAEYEVAVSRPIPAAAEELPS